MLSGAREAGCFREVAALHSDHLRQVPLYCFSFSEVNPFMYRKCVAVFVYYAQHTNSLQPTAASTMLVHVLALNYKL